MTGRDLVSASLRLLGVLASGETPEASEATDGLASLNRMISSWSNDNLLIYQITAETPITLTVGDGTYTMGTSGDFTNRPQKIVSALVRDGNTDFPIDIISAEQYAAIPDKSVQSTYPQKLYDDGGYPQRTITLWPVPSAAKSLVLSTERILTQIATIDTSVSMPEGYEEALIYNLAKRLAPEYGRSMSAEAMDVAISSLAGIKRANHRPSYLSVDPAVAARTGTYDINAGGYRT